MSENEIIAEMLHTIRIECGQEEKWLNDNYKADLTSIKFLPWKELYNLKKILNEIGDIISELNCPYELLIFDDKHEFPIGDLNYNASKLIEILAANNITNPDPTILENITSKKWFELLIKSEAYKTFWQKVHFRFNEIKENSPEDYIKFIKHLEKEQDTLQKIKWKSNVGDLGYIFKIFANLDYYEFPLTKTKTPRRNLGVIADMLINNFLVLDESTNTYVIPKRDTLKEYLGNGEKKQLEKDSRFVNGWKKANSEDREDVFNLPPRICLGE